MNTQRLQFVAVLMVVAIICIGGMAAFLMYRQSVGLPVDDDTRTVTITVEMMEESPESEVGIKIRIRFTLQAEGKATKDTPYVAELSAYDYQDENQTRQQGTFMLGETWTFSFSVFDSDGDVLMAGKYITHTVGEADTVGYLFNFSLRFDEFKVTISG